MQQSLKIIARYSIKVDGVAKTRKLSSGEKLFVPSLVSNVIANIYQNSKNFSAACYYSLGDRLCPSLNIYYN